jgi:hypothetical protein
VGQAFASVAYTTVCNAAGVATTTGFSYFNTSSQCTGTTSATTAPVAFGTCVAVGTNLWWRQNASGCAPSGAANAASSAAISGGAIAGIIVGVIVVAGAAAAYFLGVFHGGGRGRTKKALNSTSTVNPVAEAHL